MKIEWTVHPFRERPVRGIAVVFFIFAVSLYIYNFTSDIFLFIISLLTLVFSVATFLFPTRFSLDDEGITVANSVFRRTRKWIEFRNYRHGRKWIKLLAASSPESRLNNYRGLMLRTHCDKEEILYIIEQKLNIDKKDSKDE